MYRSQQQGSGEATWRLGGLDQNAVGLLALLLAMAAAAALILWLERGTTFMSDEWAWIEYSSVGSLKDFFRPLNQHLTLIPLLLTKLFLGLWDTAMTPFAIAEVAGVLACGGAVYAFARPRVGPIVALAPAMVPMFLGTGTVILLQPLIGLQVVYSLAFGVAALVAFDRGSRAGDLAAALLTCLSLASFSTGIAFLAGLTVAVLLSPDRLRRSVAFVVPAVFYGAWRLWAMKYGADGGPELANVPAVPFYWVDSVATNTAALFGLAWMIGAGPGTSLFLTEFTFSQATTAFVFAAVEVVFVVFVARKLAARRPVPVTLWSTLTVLLTLWTIQGLVLVIGRTPGEPRYIYPGAVALGLVAVAAASRFRIGRFAVAAVLALTAVGIVGNLPRFEEGRDAIAFHAPRVRAYTGMMDLAGANARPSFVPAIDTPTASPAGALSIPVETYLTLAEEYGPLGYTPAEVEGLDEEIRHGSDVVLARMLELGLERPGRAEPGRCLPVRAAGSGSAVELPEGGTLLEADGHTPVTLRRFADEQTLGAGQLQPGEPMVVRIPADTAPAPWVLEAPEPVSLSACALS